MKTVVSNSQVGHLWANQSQALARSSSMSFRGLNLYSYSTCIAAIHMTARGRVHLFNSRKYSATTSSRHMPAARNAARGLEQFATFEVPEVHNSTNADYQGEPGLSARAHSINQSYLSAEYKAFAAKLMRVQGLTGWHLTKLQDMAEDARMYAIAFDLKIDETIDSQRDGRNAQARQTRLANDPKRQARLAAQERARVAKAERDAIARVARDVDALAAFRAGTFHGGYSGLTDKDGAAYLRVNADGQTVQTSRGASVPAADAIRAIRFIRAVKYLRRTDWKRNGELCPVGKFQVDSISANGDIHAGCHFIKWEEIDATATALGMVGINV